MLTLNLTDLERSDIKYKISKFPDGQQNIIIYSREDGENSIHFTYIAGKSRIKAIASIRIISRLNNWLDLELIVCAVASLRELGVKEIHLYTPYFMGARSDRKFEDGGNWYLKQVICPIINSLKFESVTVIDAHSSVLGNLLNNYKSIDNLDLVEWSLTKIYENGVDYNNFNLASPDAGASHKIQKIADDLNYKESIITCRKERDTSGKLTQTKVPLTDYKILEKDTIIIDDICDGGRTFNNIIIEIDRICQVMNIKRGKTYLIVTHGIFSAGLSELAKYFNGIYCTNSYSNQTHGTFLKQLNVF